MRAHIINNFHLNCWRREIAIVLVPNRSNSALVSLLLPWTCLLYTSIPRYVDTFEEEELIDIEEVQGNIERIKAEIAVVEAQMAQYLKELGL